MKVYANIPDKFIYSNNMLSDKISGHDVIVGRKYTALPIGTGINDTVREISHAFSGCLGLEVPKEKIKSFVKELVDAKSKNDSLKTFKLDAGEFIVIKTAYEGGGSAMFNDSYPDGHHVFCKRVKVNGDYDENGNSIDFYQSGSFSAMIKPEELKLIETKKMTFV